MKSCQSVVCIQRVVEGDSSPVSGRVAGIARGGEGSGDVVWIRGSGEVRLVAAVAGGWYSGVVVIGVALSASQRSMRAGKWEHRCMVEG